MAILQCSTREMFPKRIVLPLIRINQDEQSHLARDGRHTFPLGPVKSDEVTRAISRTISMRQEPGETYVLRTEVLVDVQQDLFVGGGLVFFDSTISTLADHSICATWNDYYSRTDSKKGAVIIVNHSFDVLVSTISRCNTLSARVARSCSPPNAPTTAIP